MATGCSAARPGQALIAAALAGGHRDRDRHGGFLNAA
jgi:hypothetical protein